MCLYLLGSRNAQCYPTLSLTLISRALIKLFSFHSPPTWSPSDFQSHSHHHPPIVLPTHSLAPFQDSCLFPYPVSQFSSVAQLCPTLCDPMNRSMRGLPVHHQLPELTQTQVHQVGDANQPSHPLLSPFLPAPNPSQHQGLFQWINSLHVVAKILEFQLQHQFFQWTPRTDLLYDGLVGSPCSPRDSQESSPAPQFKSINSLVLNFLYSPTLTSIHDHWENHSLDQMDLCWQSYVSAF